MYGRQKLKKKKVVDHCFLSRVGYLPVQYNTLIKCGKFCTEYNTQVGGGEWNFRSRLLVFELRRPRNRKVCS